MQKLFFLILILITFFSLSRNILALTASDISNLSGYSVVEWNSDYDGFNQYSLGGMEQVGELANISNGGFEIEGDNNYPIGWSPVSTVDWNRDMFSVIDNPWQTKEMEKIDYPPEGKNFLKLGIDIDVKSEAISVEPNTEYILSYYINSSQLQKGKVLVSVRNGNLIYNTGNNCFNINDGSSVFADNVSSCSLSSTNAQAHNSWQHKEVKFKTGDFSLITLTILIQDDSVSKSKSGLVYLDDFRLRPVLLKNTNTYIDQTCRLYPQSDALACDYFNDSGIREKGLRGYCLQYDRAPGNSKTCLFWYPIDRVKGDWIEDNAGYMGKYPVYYCTEVDRMKYEGAVDYYTDDGEIFYMNGEKVSEESGWGEKTFNLSKDKKLHIIQGRNTIAIYVFDAGGLRGIKLKFYYYENGEEKILSTANPRNWRCKETLDEDEEKNWYLPEFDDSDWLFATHVGEEAETYIWSMGGVGSKAYCRTTFNAANLYCKSLVKVVNEVGNNKFWASRVVAGSNFLLDNENGIGPYTAIQHSTESIPFGSIPALYPVNNPYEWDYNSNIINNQPIIMLFGALPKITDSLKSEIYYSNYKSSVSIDSLKNLFAQSYGSWSWVEDKNIENKFNYVENNNNNWGPPKTKCDSSRPDYKQDNPLNDYCAIAPKIFNIKVDGQGNDSGSTTINITGAKMVKLTFNTDVDENQMPMTMMAIDWGDGSKDIITGAEMNDQSNENSPHTFYHLYNTVGNYVPKIKIKDNWGWCNGGTDSDSCQDTWVEFSGEINLSEGSDLTETPV